MPCACAQEICRRSSISKNHQLTKIYMCGKFHACIRNSTILALSRLANTTCSGILSRRARQKVSGQSDAQTSLLSFRDKLEN